VFTSLAESDIERVGALDRFLDRPITNDRNQGPELLFRDDAHVVRRVADHRERVNEATRLRLRPPRDDARAAGASVLDERGDLVELHAIRDGADQRFGLEPVAHRNPGNIGGELPDDVFVLGFVHIESLQGRAGLAGVDETAPEELLEQGLDFCSGQHDAGIVAAELEGDALQGSRSALHHFLARGHRACEDHFGDALMIRQVRADLGAAGDHVDDTRWEDLVHDLYETQRRERRER
jgi:hypothetical protein